MHDLRGYRPWALTLGWLATTLLAAAPSLAAEAQTTVFLNGVPAPVHFNDGDSFRVLGGRYAGTKARLAGFNTLESYGGVHQWGDWTAEELYHNAKMGTLNARRGTWKCVGDPEDKDGYGRILWVCQDLRVDQVRKGFAHVMTITPYAGNAEALAAQREAIHARRGMWAHGVPSFILTSLHSTAEGGGSDGKTYNRLVSVQDGHSEKWYHDDNYSECDTVCFNIHRLSTETEQILLKATKVNLPPQFKALSDAELLRRIHNQIDIGSAGWMHDPSLNNEIYEDLDDAVKDEQIAKSEALSEHLARVLEKIPWKASAEEKSGCMVYVDYRRRYGGKKATCLK